MTHHNKKVLIDKELRIKSINNPKYKAQKSYWRIPEKSIFVVTLLGGGIGTITGMYVFRHKTKKLKFTVGLPTILISEICVIIYLLYKGILQMLFI